MSAPIPSADAGGSPSLPEPLEHRLPAEPAAVPALRHAARDYAERLAFAPAARHAVALAVTEATTNAVLHAFVDREPGTVTLAAEPGDGEVVFRVRDDGRGLTPRVDSPGLGLGISMLGRLCAHFEVGPGPDGAGTEVRMAFAAPQLRVGRAVGLRGRLEQAFGSLADAVTVSDADGRMVYANQLAAELLGATSPEEVVDSPATVMAARFVITRADGSPVAVSDLPHRRLLDGEEHPEPLLTRSVHRGTGRARWLLTQATLLRDPQFAGERLAVSVVRDVTSATESERRYRLLDQIGEVLAASTDLHASLAAIAAAAVPGLADWCAFDLADDGGHLVRVALAHREPEKVAFGQELQRRFPPDPAADQGPYAVLRTGEPLFIAELPDAMLEEMIADPEHLALLREIGMRSVLLVPLVARDRRLGVLTLVTADSVRTFDDEDLRFALALGRRAGLAAETARRLGDS